MEVFPTSFARPVPFSIDVITPVEISMVVHPMTEGPCASAAGVGSQKCQEQGERFALFVGVSAAGSLSWVAESILGYSCVLCSTATQGTESTFGQRQQIPPCLLHQPGGWGLCSQSQVSRFRGTTSTVEPHLHSVQQIIWHEIPRRQLLAPALTEVWEWVSSWEFIHI